MSIISTLRHVSQWILNHENWKDKKYRSHSHPIFTSTVTISLFMFCCYFLDKIFNTEQRFNSSPQIRIAIGISLLIYVFIMFALRYAQNGSVVLYELMWACNLALMSAAYALFKNKPLILAASFAIVSVDQVLWYVDILSFLIFRKFPIGVAKYLIWPTTSNLRRITSFHHILFIPLCFSVLWDKKELPQNSWIMSCFMTILLSACSRLLLPHSIDTGKEIIYLNMNLSRELWKDINIKMISQFCDNSPWYVGLTTGNTIWNLGDLVSFGFLDLLFRNIK